MLHDEQYFYIIIAFALSLLVHYLVIELTHRKGIFLDEHDKVQKMHDIPTPRIGGLGIFLAFMFILRDNVLGGYLMLACIPAFVAGFMEDYSGKVSPEQRLAIMCLSPVMAFIMLPDSIFTYWPYLKVPTIAGIGASLFFIIALINGVNFTDGQNGLASGTVLVSLITLLGVAAAVKDSSIFYICLVMSVAVSAFLFYNFPRGRIFLGDGGAYLLGFMLATVTILIVQRHPVELSPLLLPALLIYPLWEVIFSTIRKLFYDKISPFHSDDFHLHQLLFRNRSMAKGYMPVLLILPAQVVVSFFVVLFRANTTGLLFIMLSYIILYSFVYFNERRIDAVKGRIVKLGS